MKTESSATAVVAGTATTTSSSSTGNTTAGRSKPNAWSKPLQGAVPIISATTTTTSSSSSSAVSNPTQTGTSKSTGSHLQSKGTGGGGGGGSASANTPTFSHSHRSNSSGSGGYAHAKSHRNHNNSNNYHSKNSQSSNSNINPSSTKSNASFQVDKTLPALRERFLHLLITLTGQKVSVTLTNGTIYTGILHTATPFVNLPPQQRFKYVLRAVTVSGSNQNNNNNNSSTTTNGVSSTNGSKSINNNNSDPVVKPGSTVVLDMEQVVQLHCKACRLDALAVVGKAGGAAMSANGDSFTDTEISRANHAGGVQNSNSSNGTTRSKDLVAVDAVWTSAGDGPALQPLTPINSKAAKLAGLSSGASMTPQPMHNNSSSGLSGSIAGWDQFKANQELFNVVSTYDENVYTTKLDPSQISAQERYRAEKIAREIENTTTTNIHLAEERGQVSSQDFADYDEEDRYSGVLKMNVPLKSSAMKVPTTKLNYAQAVSKVESQTNNNSAGNTSSAPPGFTATATVTTETNGNNDTNESVEPASIVEQKSNTVPTAASNGETKSHIEIETPESRLSKVDEPMDKDSTTQSTPIESEVKKDSTDTDLADANPVTTSATASDNAKEQPPPVKSSLSATAKSFSLNINAKTFQPTPPPPPPPPPVPPPQQHQQQQQHHHVPQPQYMYDPATGLPMMLPQHMMPGGMMPPMMNAGQYPGMRYGGQYPGMEYGQPPPMPHVQQHQIHLPHQQQSIPIPPSQPIPSTGATTSSTATSNVTSPTPPEDPSTSIPTGSASEDGSLPSAQPAPESTGDTVATGSDASSSHIQQPVPVVTPQHPSQQPQRQHPPPQQQQMHHPQHNISMQQQMYYPGTYYNPAASIGMYPPQTLPPQQHGQIGGPPQQQYISAHMAVQMQRQMYGPGPVIPGGGMPPNMMRGPPQAYYPGPNGPVPYPPYGVGGNGIGTYGGDDEMIGNMNAYGRGNGGRGGRGPGGGRGGRNSGGRGQGRGNNSNMNGGGRTGGGRGRYNHQYSGGSNSLGDSGRETPLDNPQQQTQSAPTAVQNEVPPLSTEHTVRVDANANNNNNASEVTTPSNKDESATDTSTIAAVDTSTVPTVTPSIDDSIGN